MIELGKDLLAIGILIASTWPRRAQRNTRGTKLFGV